MHFVVLDFHRIGGDNVALVIDVLPSRDIKFPIMPWTLDDRLSLIVSSFPPIFTTGHVSCQLPVLAQWAGLMNIVVQHRIRSPVNSEYRDFCSLDIVDDVRPICLKFVSVCYFMVVLIIAFSHQGRRLRFRLSSHERFLDRIGPEYS